MKKHKYFVSFNYNDGRKNKFANAEIQTKKRIDFSIIESIQKNLEKTYSIKRVVIINFIKL